MKKIALILLNVILACFFLYLLLGSTYIIVPGDNIFSVTERHWDTIVFFLFIILNLRIVYKLLIKKDQKNLKRYALETLCIFLGFFVFFGIGMVLSTSEAPKGSPDEEIFRLQILK